jgi:hypothetical protein
MSLCQLIPHLQCFSPTNCCTIFSPQFGHTLFWFSIAAMIEPSTSQAGFFKAYFKLILPFDLEH